MCQENSATEMSSSSSSTGGLRQIEAIELQNQNHANESFKTLDNVHGHRSPPSRHSIFPSRSLVQEAVKFSSDFLGTRLPRTVRAHWNPSQRSFFVFMISLAGGLVWALRTDMSVAIVVMVPRNVSRANSTTTITTTQQYFDWSVSTRGTILSSYFYGYTITQVVGGRLAEVHGGLWPMAVGVGLPGLATLLCPLAARIHVSLLIALRALIGFGNGLVFSAIFQMVAVWTPRHERGAAISWMTVGCNLGAMVAMLTSGYVIENRHMGWPWVFYISGMLSLVWAVLWVRLMSSFPEDHPRISPAERDYIRAHTNATGRLLPSRAGGSGGGGRHSSSPSASRAPWGALFRSKCVWALIVVRLTGEYGFYVLATKLPDYLKSVFRMDITSNGIFNGLLYLVLVVPELFAGYAADWLASKKCIPLTLLRKVMQTISMLGPAIAFCLVPICGSNDVNVAIALIFIAMILYSFLCGGEYPLLTDYAQDLSGTVYGIVNTAGSLAGIAAPTITSAILELHSGSSVRAGWNYVFYLTGLIYVIGLVVFNVYATSVSPEWVNRSQPLSQSATEDITDGDKAASNPQGSPPPPTSSLPTSADVGGHVNPAFSCSSVETFMDEMTTSLTLTSSATRIGTTAMMMTTATTDNTNPWNGGVLPVDIESEHHYHVHNDQQY